MSKEQAKFDLLGGILEKVLFILAFSVLATTSISRLILRHIPLNRDEGTYLYLAKQATSGMRPYIDFYEMKPPVLFYLTGVFGALFGFDEAGGRMITLIFVTISALFVFLIVKYYASNTLSLAASAIYAFFSLNLFCLGFSFEIEHLVNALLLASLYFVLKTRDRPTLLNFALSGLFFSLAVLTKQTSIIFILVHVTIWFTGTATARKNWKSPAIFIVGALVPAILVSLLFTIHGSWEDAYFWLVTYPSSYTGGGISEENRYQNLNYFFGNITKFQLASFLLTGLALAIGLLRGMSKNKVWILIYLALSLLSIFPGYRFYGQYWQLIWPPLALAAFILFPMPNQKKWIGTTFFVLLMLTILFDLNRQKGYYFNEKYSEAYNVLYYQNPFDAIKTLSLYAKKQMNSGDKFLVMG